MLAAETQDGCTGYIRVVNVSSKQAAESLRILSRASASAFVNEKPDAVNIGKNALTRDGVLQMGGGGLLQMPVNQLSDLLCVLFGAAVSQFCFEDLAQRLDIAIFTKYQRDHEPAVSRADLPIFAVIAMKGALLPARDIRGRPLEMGVSAREIRRVMLNVSRA